jgi:hypothetical protein
MDAQKKLQCQWLTGIISNHIGHTIAASFYKRYDRIIGLISTIFAAVVSTTIFASLADSRAQNLVLVAGITSLIATILSAVFAFLKYGELSEQHRQAAKNYGTLRREMELLMLQNDIPQEKLLEEMVSINNRRNEFESSVPTLPSGIFQNALKKARESSAVKLFEDEN